MIVSTAWCQDNIALFIPKCRIDISVGFIVYSSFLPQKEMLFNYILVGCKTKGNDKSCHFFLIF